MMRGIEKTYSKPNMSNLHGRMGAQIMRKLRQQTVNDDNIRKEVEEIPEAETEDELMDRLEKSRKSAMNGEFKDADQVVVEMRQKYGIL